MRFTLLPTIDIMLDFYEQPRGFERFQQYIKALQGETKGDLSFPVSGFNPMAKEHVTDKLYQLKQLGAEQLIEKVLTTVNKTFSKKNAQNFRVALNLSDDLMGGWTNRYTSDYDSKFKFNGLFSRNFCVPVFWTSEVFTKEIITQRTAEYVFRTMYWLSHPKPKILKEHVEQEQFVANEISAAKQVLPSSLSKLHEFYIKHQYTDNYAIIFNFFYGDKASQSLGLTQYGINEKCTGFDFVYAKQSLKK
jgi:hypothetical protein